MDPLVPALYQAIKFHTSGETEKAIAAATFIGKLQADFVHLISALIDLIPRLKNGKSKASAILLLTSELRIHWQELSQDQQKLTIEFILNIIKSIDDLCILPFTGLLTTVFNLSQTPFDNIEKYFTENEFDQRATRLAIALVWSRITDPTDSESSIVQMMNDGRVAQFFGDVFGMDDIFCATLGVSSLTQFIHDYPDQVEALIPQIHTCVHLANKSMEWSEVDFLSLWNALRRFYPDPLIDGIPFDLFVEPANQALQSNRFSAETKFAVINLFTNCIPYLEYNVIMDFEQKLLVLCHDYIVVTNDLPIQFLDHSRHLFQLFFEMKTWEITHEMFQHCINQNDESWMATAFLLMVLWVQIVPHRLLSNFDYYHDLLMKALKSESDILKAAALSVIINFPESYQWNLFDVNSLLDALIPFLLHPTVWHLVFPAVDNLIKTTKGVLPNLYSKLRPYFDEVVDKRQFLTTLSYSVGAQAFFEQEEAFEICQFCLQLLSADDQDLFVPGTYLSLAIMKVNDLVHEPLLPPLKQLLAQSVLSEDLTERNFAVRQFAVIAQIFPGEEMPPPNLIMDLLHETEWPSTAVALSQIEKAKHERSCVPFLLEHIPKWMHSSDPDISLPALRCIKHINPLLDDQERRSLLTAVSELAIGTEHALVLQKAVRVLEKCCDDGCLDIGDAVISTYLDGSLGVLRGIPPETNDMDLMPFLYLSLFSVKIARADTITKYYNFVMDIYRFRKFPQHAAYSSHMWGLMVNTGLLNDDQINEIKQESLSMLQNDVEFGLMTSASNSLISLIQSGRLTKEEIAPHFPCLFVWFDRVMVDAGKVNICSIHVISLIWCIAAFLRCVPELQVIVEKGVREFPPKDIKSIKRMTNWMVRCFTIQFDVPVSLTQKGAVALSQILTFPQTLLRRMEFDENFMAEVEGMLKRLIDSSPEVKEVVVDFIGDCPSRQAILSKFL